MNEKEKYFAHQHLIKARIQTMLDAKMTTKGRAALTVCLQEIPNIWDLPTSSSKKYHQKEDEGGRVPSNQEHTYEVLKAAAKSWRIFAVEDQTEEADLICFIGIFHDAFKYGMNPSTSKHTDKKHGDLACAYIVRKEDLLKKVLSPENIRKLKLVLTYHDGRWSPEAKKGNFDFNKLSPLVLWFHTLDVLSSQNLIKGERLCV